MTFWDRIKNLGREAPPAEEPLLRADEPAEGEEPEGALASDDERDAAHANFLAGAYLDAQDTAGAMRPAYRRTRHAFKGARAYLTDLAAGHFPPNAAMISATNLDPAGIEAEARRMLDAMRADGVLGVEEAEAALLVQNIAQFVAVTYYAGWLMRSTFTDDWLRAHEVAVDERVEERAVPGGPKED